jgi:hypothetical protein
VVIVVVIVEDDGGAGRDRPSGGGGKAGELEFSQESEKRIERGWVVKGQTGLAHQDI